MGLLKDRESLKDKVERFLHRVKEQDDARAIALSAEEVADAARRLYREHHENGELTPLLKKMGRAAVKVSEKHSRKFIMSEWVKDIRESMDAIEEIVRKEEQELF